MEGLLVDISVYDELSIKFNDVVTGSDGDDQ
jgi:hypothetical protein